MDLSNIWQLIRGIADGLLNTVGIFMITIVCSLPLGLLCAFGRNSKFRLMRGFLNGYVWVFRGTPLLLQLYFFLYGITFLPYVGDYLKMERFTAAIVAFVINYTAYFCEIFRGGLKSIESGQYEAAKVLGLNRWQTVTRVVIPQMLKVSLPSISNESITLVKDTALVRVISVTELLYFATAAVNRESSPVAYAVVALFYLIMTYGLTQVFKFLEKKYTF